MSFQQFQTDSEALSDVFQNLDLTPRINVTNQYVGIPLESHSEPENPVNIDWSDEYFETNYLKQFCYRAYPSYTRCREACKAFLNFYVSGRIYAPLMDVWLLTVYGIQAPKCKTDIRLITPKTIDPTSTRDFSPIPDTAKIENLSETAPIEDETFAAEITCLKAWYDSLWKDLDYKSVDDHDTVSDDAHGAMNFIGYIALTVLRCSIKDEDKVGEHLKKSTANQFMSFWQKYNYFDLGNLPKPHPSFLKICRNSFIPFHPNFTLALTLLVGTYKYPEADPFVIRTVLHSACLLSLSMAGLGCWYWTSMAIESRKRILRTIMSFLSTNRHAETLHLVMDYMVKYLKLESNEITWRWANMFHCEAIKGLANEDNMEYALINMAISTGAHENSPMWNSKQFKGKYTCVQKAFSLIMADKIIKSMRIKGGLTARNPLAKKVQKSLIKSIKADDRVIDVAFEILYK